MACKCGCGFGSTEADIATDLIFALHILRRNLAVPFVITSAARCAKHNLAEGGKTKSTHLPGVKGLCTPEYEKQCRAVDIQTVAWSTDLRGRAVAMALSLGMRVGIAASFIHFDVEDSPYYSRGVWNYSASENSGV
jgi:hypothetical protein